MGEWRRWSRGGVCGVIILAAGACGREEPAPSGPALSVPGGVHFTLSADQTSGAIPLTVTFTGTLAGSLDTLRTRVPEISLAGGASSDADQYSSLPDTLAAARQVYTAREHYFRAGTFRAVMRLHARGGDILSDTLVIHVLPG